MRLFIALDCNDFRNILDPIIEKLEGPGIKKVTTYHLTLAFFRDADPQEILDQLNLSYEPVKLTLQGLGHFNNKVIWVGVSPQDPILGLKKEIDMQLGLDEDRFHPHITLVRLKQKAKLPQIKVPEESAYPRLFLFKSTLTKEGPIHEKLHEF